MVLALYNQIKIAWKIACNEIKIEIRSTKILLYMVFFVFLKIQVIDSFKEMTVEMGSKISFIEPFIATINSALVGLILPLLFLTCIATFPRDGRHMYFTFLRVKKRTWITGQLIYDNLYILCIILLTLLGTILLSADISKISFEYSDCIIKYRLIYPEYEGTYKAMLLMEKIYNQDTLVGATFMSVILQWLYFNTLSLIVFTAYIFGKKIVGIIIDGMLIVAGTITCALGLPTRWLFPSAHSIFWMHYTGYTSEMVFSMAYSILYFVIIDVVLIVLVYIFAKRLRMK